MSTKDFDILSIPQEKFEFANKGERLSDKKFEDKPISYFKDAWIRFRKNKASIAAAIIIMCIVLFAVLVPIFRPIDVELDPYYAKMGPKNSFLSKFGIATGAEAEDMVENMLIFQASKGIGADSKGDEIIAYDQVSDKYDVIRKVGSTREKSFTHEIIYDKVQYDTYLAVGFLNTDIEQSEYYAILEWEKENNLKVLYPLIDTESEYYPADIAGEGKEAGNYWYKAIRYKGQKLTPVRTVDENGEPLSKPQAITYSEDMVLEDNFLRDENGDLVYWKYSGGGDADTAMYRVRVLYYNYYQYKLGYEPQFLFGTDSQGYDLMTRLAIGIRLSLLVAVFVSVINFVLGAMYGAVEGYYGGAVDMVLERISDILNGVPFIIVATLFQMHLAQKVGAIPSLLFAFVVTGWIGTAARVRTQFYRFKNQEYVMAARTLGAKDSRIIWKHIFPNSLGTIITSSALVIPSVIFSESMLSFLGIVNLSKPDTTSLGTLLSEASRTTWTEYPHLLVFPAIVISLLMICFNLFGNGLRDAFNPSLRGVEE